MKCLVRGYKGAGFGAGFIKWFTFSKFSHVSLVFDMGHDVHEIEAIQGKGVVRHAPHSIKDLDFVEYNVPLSHDQILIAHQEATELLDSDYDWSGVWGFVQRKKKHNKFKWFCSELVAYVLFKAGYMLSRRKPFQETPATVCDSKRLDDPVMESGGA